MSILSDGTQWVLRIFSDITQWVYYLIMFNKHILW